MRVASPVRARRLTSIVLAAALASVPLVVAGAAAPATRVPALAAQQDRCAAPPAAQYRAQLKTPDAMPVAPNATVLGQATLDLAARPTPIDVFFVLDSSPSMDAVFDSLKDSINQAGDELRATGIDIWVGVADFADLYNRPYRRVVALGPLDCRVEEGLDRVRTGGGGAEPHRLALEQAVAGTGRRQVGVAAGLGAHWRPNTLRLIMHATDTGIDEALPLSPTHENLIAMFLDRNVHHVGIRAVDDSIPLVSRGEENRDRAQRDLERLSRDTRTLAPPLPSLGLDCNADGVPDVLPEQPVVCPFMYGGPVGGVRGASMGEIVTQVVKTLRSTTGVELVVTDSGGTRVTVESPVREIDLSKPGKLDYKFSLSCPAELMGKQVPIRFDARVAGVTIARSTTTASCLAPPPPAAAPRAPIAVAISPAPAPVSVAPSSALQGASQASQVGATAQAPVPSPIFGMAAAPEQELQVARANVGTGDGGRPARVAGALMALGAAGALRRRTNPAYQRQRR